MFPTYWTRLMLAPLAGGTPQIGALQGIWTPSRIVLIEFDDAEQATTWWESAEYTKARAIHRQTTIPHIILIDDPID